MVTCIEENFSRACAAGAARDTKVGVHTALKAGGGSPAFLRLMDWLWSFASIAQIVGHSHLLI